MYEYEIDKDRVSMTFRGDVNNGQIRQAYEEVTNDPSFQSGSQVLVDDLESNYNPSIDDAQKLVAIFASFTDRISQFAVLLLLQPFRGRSGQQELICITCCWKSRTL